MNAITLKAYAKINLTLDVTGKRENGYHDVEMIMQQVDLHDNVTVTKRKDSLIGLTSNVDYIPMDKSNIAWKAAEAIRKYVNSPLGVDIHIEKNIPVAAGLAGGSTNAAAVINGMNTLFDLDLTMAQRREIAVRLGADVPFCIRGGCALAKGIGEELTYLQPAKSMWIVLAKPTIGVSTKTVYEALDYQSIRKHPDTQAMLDALQRCNVNEVSALLGNVLEEVTLKLYPVVGEVKQKLKEYGANGVLMSGSGPTVFGLFNNLERAQAAGKNLQRLYPQTYVTKTVIGGKEHGEENPSVGDSEL